MLKRRKKGRKNPSNNPLANLNMKSFYEETKEKEKVKGDSYGKIQKEYDIYLDELRHQTVDEIIDNLSKALIG